MCLTIHQAVDLLYHGRSNLMKAAEDCGESPDTLKQLLLEKVQSKPKLDFPLTDT